MKSNIGLIGIGVMGENLALNMESKGFAVSVYDISQEKVQKFIDGRAKGKKITGAISVRRISRSIRETP